MEKYKDDMVAPDIVSDSVESVVGVQIVERVVTLVPDAGEIYKSYTHIRLEEPTFNPPA